MTGKPLAPSLGSSKSIKLQSNMPSTLDLYLPFCCSGETGSRPLPPLSFVVSSPRSLAQERDYGDRKRARVPRRTSLSPVLSAEIYFSLYLFFCGSIQGWCALYVGMGVLGLGSLFRGVFVFFLGGKRGVFCWVREYSVRGRGGGLVSFLAI